MDRNDIKRIFEAFFEKYKKTEGDRTVWSAVWTDMKSDSVLELNITKCPRGTILKVFVNKKKAIEVEGFDAYFTAMKKLAADHPGLYEPDRIFNEIINVL